jgi:hypothetical protein
MLFVESDSYLKGTNYVGAMYLHYGNQINVGTNYEHMVINYYSGKQTLARICDG